MWPHFCLINERNLFFNPDFFNKNKIKNEIQDGTFLKVPLLFGVCPLYQHAPR